MNADEKDFVERVREAYRPDEMTAQQTRRFDEALSQRLNHSHGRSRPLTWVMAMAVAAVGLFFVGQMRMQPAIETNEMTGDAAVVAHVASANDAWPMDDDLPSLTLDDLEHDGLDEILQDEWLPDDYQALAAVIDFNLEEEI